jgi:hypothetical protein
MDRNEHNVLMRIDGGSGGFLHMETLLVENGEVGTKDAKP